MIIFYLKIHENNIFFKNFIFISTNQSNKNLILNIKKSKFCKSQFLLEKQIETTTTCMCMLFFFFLKLSSLVSETPLSLSELRQNKQTLSILLLPST